ncbi:MAG: hypothetical protein Q4E17_05910 [Synergistes sp.]|nr:hypothetical protein [Synergistes sp.]
MSEEQFEEMQKNEVEELKAKLAELKAKLQEKETAELEKCDAEEAKDDCCDTNEVLKKLRDGLENLYEEISPLLDKCKEKHEAAAATAKESIAKHPLTALAVSFGVGFVLAKIVNCKICSASRNR